MDLLHAQRENGVLGKQALTLVFVETKKGADALGNWLYMNGFPAFFNENNSSLAQPLAELMQESNQEVPTWLTHYASRSYGGGKNRWSGGGNRFSGWDVRREGPFNRATGYYGGGYNNPAYGYPSGYAACSAGVASVYD